MSHLVTTTNATTLHKPKQFNVGDKIYINDYSWCVCFKEGTHYSPGSISPRKLDKGIILAINAVLPTTSYAITEPSWINDTIIQRSDGKIIFVYSGVLSLVYPPEPIDYKQVIKDFVDGSVEYDVLERIANE